MNNLAIELSKLIETGSKKYPLPYKKGNSIRIGKVIIRAKKDGFILFDCVEHEQICMTESKFGALAVAKLYIEDKDIDHALYLDRKYQKHHNDCAFYEHIINSAADNFKKDLAQVRLDLSEAHRSSIVSSLEDIIFD